MKGDGGYFTDKCSFIDVVVVTLVGGCSTTSGPENVHYYLASNEISELNEKILSQAQMSSDPGEILIGEGDLLQVSVFEAKELDKTVRVNSTGFYQSSLSRRVPG